MDGLHVIFRCNLCGTHSTLLIPMFSQIYVTLEANSGHAGAAQKVDAAELAGKRRSRQNPSEEVM